MPYSSFEEEEYTPEESLICGSCHEYIEFDEPIHETRNGIYHKECWENG